MEILHSTQLDHSTDKHQSFIEIRRRLLVNVVFTDIGQTSDNKGTRSNQQTKWWYQTHMQQILIYCYCRHDGVKRSGMAPAAVDMVGRSHTNEDSPDSYQTVGLLREFRNADRLWIIDYSPAASENHRSTNLMIRCNMKMDVNCLCIDSSGMSLNMLHRSGITSSTALRLSS